MSQNLQFCTFSLDNLLFGVPLTDVQEVMRHTDMTQVPLAPTVVRGLINLRGQIVTAIDLRRKLEFAQRSDDNPPMNVVVRSDEGAVSLLVDEIGDVVEVGEDAFEPPPETLRGTVRNVILGVYKLSGRLMHVLDTARACQIADKVEKATTPV